MSPTVTPSVATAFNLNQPAGAACFTYEIVDASNNPVSPLPSYLAFSFPTLTIGTTTAGIIGTAST
jgi:hypothetical protein